MSSGRVLTVIGAIFGVVGVVLAVIGGSLLMSSVSFDQSAGRTEGTVVELVQRTSTSSDRDGYQRTTTVYAPRIRFDANGEEFTFTSSIGSDPPAYEPGEKVSVAYDPNRPGNARLATFWGLYTAPFVLGIIAVVFLPLGVVLLVFGIRRMRLRAWLRRSGTEAWAEITGVGRNTRVRINGRHPFVINAGWQDPRTGQHHEVQSDNYTKDPSPMIEGRTHLRVLYDPDRPEHCIIDRDWLQAPNQP